MSFICDFLAEMSGCGGPAQDAREVGPRLVNTAICAAVLAHERAHLHGGHLDPMMLLRALATAMSRLPLIRSAVQSVDRLVEM